jgi:hypothetical protein
MQLDVIGGGRSRIESDGAVAKFERNANTRTLNVDWLRFRVQGYEAKAPDDDPDQYVRWMKLRDQQEWNERMQVQGKDPSAEFLRQTLRIF